MYRLLSAIRGLILDPHGTFKTIFMTTKFMLKELVGTKRFANRNQLFDYSIKQSKFDGLILEFGVAQGKSINYLASILPNDTIYGFDCFTGLPEKWGNLPKGYFKTETLPNVRENVKLIVGLFEDTLNRFLQEHKEKVRFIHVDADLCSSTVYVLQTLIEQKRIQKGAVIQFDEFFNYVDWWKDGEFKALQELTDMFKIRYKILGYSLATVLYPGQITIRIIDVNC